METVRLAGRTVHRLGISLAGLRATGMWGEPAVRADAISAIRRAVELGAGVLEVPMPFGPAADLLREAEVAGAFIAARLTQPVRDVDVLRSRLGGRTPDLVLAGGDLLPELASWGVALGVIGDQGLEGVAAVRGPFPAAKEVLQWCESRQIPYMATETAVLDEGECTIALPAPTSVSEVERVFARRATPPAGGPG